MMLLMRLNTHSSLERVGKIPNWASQYTRKRMTTDAGKSIPVMPPMPGPGPQPGKQHMDARAGRHNQASQWQVGSRTS